MDIFRRLNIGSLENRMMIRTLIRRPNYRYKALNRIAPHFPWLILFALSLYFYKSRILDNSGTFLFEIINTKFFVLKAFEFSNILLQIPILIGVWVNIQMKYLLVIFSLAPILFSYSIFLIVYYGLNDRRSGSLILMCQLGSVAFSFYTPYANFVIGGTLIAFFVALWNFRNTSSRQVLLLLIIEILILTSGFIFSILFVFFLLFTIDRKNKKPAKYYFIFSIVYIIVLFVNILAMNKFISFDFDKLTNLVINTFQNSIFNSELALSSAKNWLQAFPEIYIISFFALIFIILNKKYFHILLVIIFLTIILSFSPIYSKNIFPWRIEIAFYPIALIIFASLIYNYRVQTTTRLHALSLLLVSAFVIYSLIRIYDSGLQLNCRATQIENMSKSARYKKSSKFIFEENKSNMKFSFITPSLPVESMILSSVKSKIDTKILTPVSFINSGNISKVTNPNELIITDKSVLNKNTLNSNFFFIDLSKYQLLNDTTATKQNINPVYFAISANSKRYYKAGDTVTLPITIINNGSDTLFTGGKNNIEISYLLIKNGNIIQWDGLKTKMNADLIRENRQYIYVLMPAKPGKYQIKVDILINGRWLGAGGNFDIWAY